MLTEFSNKAGQFTGSRVVTRFKAFWIHLSLTALVILSYTIIVRYFWYPGDLFQLERVWEVMIVVFGVDLVLGPSMTLVLFKPGKKGLKFDMSMVLVMQIVALSWGVWVTYSERPLYITYDGDIMFSSIPASKVIYSPMTPDNLRRGGQQGPMLAFLDLPKDPKQLYEIVEKAHSAGALVTGQTQYYKTLAEKSAELHRLSVDIKERLVIYPGYKPSLNRFLGNVGEPEEAFLFYPLEGRGLMAILVLRKDDLSFQGILFE